MLEKSVRLNFQSMLAIYKSGVDEPASHHDIHELVCMSAFLKPVSNPMHFCHTGYTRVPVYEGESRQNIVGILYRCHRRHLQCRPQSCAPLQDVCCYSRGISADLIVACQCAQQGSDFGGPR